MWTLLLALGCAEEWGADWVGVCRVEDRDIPVEIEYSEQGWGILQGEIVFDDEWDADFEGARSADELELTFWVDVDDYEWRGTLTGEVDGDDLDAVVTFLGSEYEAEGDCEIEED